MYRHSWRHEHCNSSSTNPSPTAAHLYVRPVHLLRVSLLRVLETNFPGDSLYDYMDTIVPTP